MSAITYSSSIPQATDQISQSQPLILQNFTAINQLIEVDHATFASSNAGFHNQVTLPVQGSAPSFAAGNIGLYSLLNATTTKNELYINLSSGTNIPMTACSTFQTGYTYLPSGILMQWGKATGTGSVPQTFLIPFPNACWNIQTTSQTNASSTDTNCVGIVSAITTTGFNIYLVVRDSANTPVSTTNNMFWFAVGY